MKIEFNIGHADLNISIHKLVLCIEFKNGQDRFPFRAT